MSNLYRGSAIDASFQVSVHLDKRFQRRRLKKNQTNQKQKLLMAAFIKDLARMLPTKFRFIWPSDFRGEYF